MAGRFIKRSIIAMVIFCSSCRQGVPVLTSQQNAAVKDSVQTMARAIAKDVTLDGAAAWLRYFEDTPAFFMASGGELQFANYDTAKTFINNTLIKSIRKIELHWGDVRVDPLTPELAGMATTFTEKITGITGKEIEIAGYFTGIAKQTPQGWKLHNAHWSMVP